MSAAERKCLCGASLAGRRADAKTCSPRCRKTRERGGDGTPRPRTVNVTQNVINKLVDHGHVAEWDEGDRGALGEAIGKILDEVFAHAEG